MFGKIRETFDMLIIQYNALRYVYTKRVFDRLNKVYPTEDDNKPSTDQIESDMPDEF